jgi:acetyl-CoA carboxylase biotin carboxyl carrier protein
MKKKSSKPAAPDGIAEIRAFMAEHHLDDLVLEDGDEKIEVKSASTAPIGVPSSVAAPASAAAPAPASAYHQIRTPMSGTFYRAASPNADPYVKEGDAVSAGVTVCVIEAMKVMNEIKAEVSGRIVKICIENAAAVESGAPLGLDRV